MDLCFFVLMWSNKISSDNTLQHVPAHEMSILDWEGSQFLAKNMLEDNVDFHRIHFSLLITLRNLQIITHESIVVLVELTTSEIEVDIPENSPSDI